MSIETDKIIDEFRGAVQTALEGIYSKHLPPESESYTVFDYDNRLKFKCAEYKVLSRLLHDADGAIKRLKRCKHVAQNAVIRRKTRPLLIEIVQRIISLAYDNETLEKYYIDPFETESVGARALARHTNRYRRVHNLLLSTSILDIRNPRQQRIMVEYTDPVKLDISYSHCSLGSDSTSFILRHAPRIRRLTIDRPSDLKACISALPYIRALNVSSTFRTKDDSETDWPAIRNALEDQTNVNILSSTLSFGFLPDFTASGLFSNLISLRIHFSDIRDEQEGKLPSVDYLDIVAQLRHLRSLELAGTLDCIQEKEPNIRHDFHSLKRLNLTSCTVETAKRLLLHFSRCNLDEVFFDYFRNLGDNFESFVQTLSDTFPTLKKLGLKTIMVRKLLYDETNKRWNFPDLQTLELDGSAGKYKSDADDVLELPAVLKSRTLEGIPINSLRFHAPEFLIDEGWLTRADVFLIRHRLEEVVPNLIWTEYYLARLGEED